MTKTTKQYIERIEQYLEEFESIIPNKFKDYQNLKTKAACERYIEKIAEAISDLAFKITNSENPFEVLKAEKMKQLKGLRNLLAHQYGNIDDKIVYNSIRTIPNDVRSFLKDLSTHSAARQLLQSHHQA